MIIKMLRNNFYRFRVSLHGDQGSGMTTGMTRKKIKKQKGYVAMATVLVVGFIMLSTGMAAVLNSINEVQSSFGETQKEEVIGFVESCVHDALLDISKTNALAGTIVLPDGSCTVTINSQVGNNWDFTVSGTYLGYKKNMRITATRASTVTITSWLEI